MIDANLIEQVKARDQGAFEEMYNATIRYVYAIVQRYVNNDSDVPDLIQEVFARVFLSIDTFDPAKGPFKPWLRRLTINECFKQYRRSPKTSARFIPLDEAPAEELNTIDQQLKRFSETEISTYLKGMPEGYRKVFLLVVMDEYSHKEVGELLGITPETSRSQLLRAKRWLKKNLFFENQKIATSGLQ